MITQFRQHWYAPARAANFDLITGRPVDGGAMYHTTRNDGSTSGLGAVKPFPLDSDHCYVHLDGDDVIITLRGSLVDYYRGSPQEIADLLVELGRTARWEDHVPIRGGPQGPWKNGPYATPEEWVAWEAEGKRRRDAHEALCRERAALIAAIEATV